MRFSLAFTFGSLSHATYFMRVSLTVRIQVSISYYASVLVFCMMDIWMFSLAKICRHASRVLTHLRQRFFWPLFPIGSWTLRAVTHDEAGLEQGRARFWRRKVQDKNPYSESSLKIGHPCFWNTLQGCASHRRQVTQRLWSVGEK